MNKTILSLLALFIAANADSSLKDALYNSKLSFNGRVFYFDRNFDRPNTPNSKALTAGGIAKIETKELSEAKIGAAYYGSYLLGVTQRNDGVSSGLLEQTSGNNISLLGELYFEQTYGKTTFTAGRQRLFTPLANDHDLRLLPSSYEAITLKTEAIDKNIVEIGYIKRYTGFASKYNAFKDETHIWGKRGLSYVYIQNKNIDAATLRAQYIKALDGKNIAVKDYRYFDAAYEPSFGTIKLQYGGNDYAGANNSLMYGALAEVKTDLMDVGAVYDKIIGNSFKAVESGAMYTDWQQGYTNYERSEAVGGYITIRPASNLSLKVGKVWVRALNDSAKDDFTESNIDFWYEPNKSNKLRIRYSDKDQTPWTNIEDRKDFRVAYYFGFAKP
ncbi:MAG: hypothetical protein AB7D29_08915 [Campylobacterales bacterium]